MPSFENTAPRAASLQGVWVNTSYSRMMHNTANKMQR